MAWTPQSLWALRPSSSGLLPECSLALQKLLHKCQQDLFWTYLSRAGDLEKQTFPLCSKLEFTSACEAVSEALGLCSAWAHHTLEGPGEQMPHLLLAPQPQIGACWVCAKQGTAQYWHQQKRLWANGDDAASSHGHVTRTGNSGSNCATSLRHRVPQELLPHRGLLVTVELFLAFLT